MKTLTQTHTPGPWGIRINGGDALIVYSLEAGRIALLHDPIHKRDGQLEANARLIAAAPDLLMALKNAAAQFDFSVAALEKGNRLSSSSLQNCAAAARAAIAKATQL